MANIPTPRLSVDEFRLIIFFSWFTSKFWRQDPLYLFLCQPLSMSGFEVIGAIAAAGQFIGQGLKLVRLIETVYSQIRDAPDEIKERLERLESFASIAKRIRNNESLQTSEAEKILLRCEHHVQKLQSCLEAIAFKADDPLKQRAWIALCSLGEEDEILKIFEKLEREQSLLVLHFSDLNRYAQLSNARLMICP